VGEFDRPKVEEFEVTNGALALYAFQGHELMQGKGIERRGKSRDTGRNGNTDSEFDR
jgi:hypothetical protein